MIVEHEWGNPPRLHDEYLDAIRQRGIARPSVVDYSVTWTGMTGGEPRPTVIRLELRIDGLRATTEGCCSTTSRRCLSAAVDADPEGDALGLFVDRHGLNPENHRWRTSG